MGIDHEKATDSGLTASPQLTAATMKILREEQQRLAGRLRELDDDRDRLIDQITANTNARSVVRETLRLISADLIHA